MNPGPDDPTPPARVPRAAAGTRPLYLDRNLMIVFSITMVGVMGVSSITPALPNVARAFGISATEVGWLLAGFAMPGIVLAPVAGLLADRLGRKAVLVPSLLIFAVAGHACAYADGFGQLLFLRVLQGVGAASLGSLNATLIGDLYSGNDRAAAMGYNGGLIAAAAAGYPLIGGALAVFGWRYPFVLPLLALPVTALIAFGLRNPEPYRHDSFAAYLRKLAACLGSWKVAAVFFAGLTGFVVLYGAKLTFMPFLLEHRFGSDSIGIGMVFAFAAIGSAVASSFLGRLSRRFRPRTILLSALATVAFSMTLMPFAPSVWAIVAISALSGAGHAIGTSMTQILLGDAAPAEQRGAMMALNGMMFRVGQTSGPLMLGLAYVAGGVDWVFWSAAAFAALAFLIYGAASRR